MDSRFRLVLPVAVFFVAAMLPPVGYGASSPQKRVGLVSTKPVSAPTIQPIVVEVRTPDKSPDELRQEDSDRSARIANDREAIAVNRRIVQVSVGQLCVFGLQLIVFGYQAFKLRQTVSAANSQSTDMKASIAQATRAAAAMELMAASMAVSSKSAAESVATLKERTALQMRAYLSVVAGGGVYQEREKQYKFEAKPLLQNSGNTPAHKVGLSSKAAILPNPLPADFILESPGPPTGSGVIDPHQDRILTAVVEDFVEDDQVERIKRADGLGLYVWGVVAYDDVFGEGHTINFCQLTTWLPNNHVLAYYTQGRNDST